LIERLDALVKPAAFALLTNIRRERKMETTILSRLGIMQKVGLIEIRHGELVLPDVQWIMRHINIDEVTMSGVKSPHDDCHACL
jgi:hypothetical protein